MPTPNIDWKSIRPFRGSQHDAFEEVCCQLFAQENIPDGSRFFRKGDGADAGVEAYWKITSGEEYALQAKYLFDIDAAISQTNDSVEAFINKHPEVKKYIVCYPFDFAESRIDGNQTQKVKWDSAVLRWKKLAEGNGLEVEFVIWGYTELSNRLTQDKNVGMIKYWFDKDLFDTEWFEDKYSNAKSNIGERYQPEHHVTLEIERLFEGLLLSQLFQDNLKSLCNNIHINWNKLDLDFIDKYVPDAIDHLKESWIICLNVIRNIHSTSQLELKGIINLRNALDKFDNIKDKISSSFYQGSGQIRSDKSKTEDENFRNELNRIQYHSNKLQDFGSATSDLIQFLYSNTTKLALNPRLILQGEGGIGKTHLLSKIVESHKNQNLPGILLLGDQFSTGHIIKQIRECLDLNDCGDVEFLGSLQTAAIAHECRALICIDAVNDSSDPTVWKKQLNGFLTQIAKYPSIALVISIRNGNEGSFLPDDYEKSSIAIEHRGLSLDTDEDLVEYFGIRNINVPSSPMLMPEINNFLFLRLLCDTLQMRGETRIPAGVRGIKSVFEYYLSAINKEFIDNGRFDPTTNYVHGAVMKIATEMAMREQNYISKDEAKHFLNVIDPQPNNPIHTASLYGKLCQVGILREIKYWSETSSNGEWNVEFMFERFSDNYIATAILDQYNDLDELRMAYQKNRVFINILEPENRNYQRASLITALTIAIPEKFEGEELANYYQSNDAGIPGYLCDAFLESLSWRDISAYNESTKMLIVRILDASESWRDKLFDRLIMVSVKPDCPINAVYLNKIMVVFGMPKRDSEWSTYLHRGWRNYDTSPVRRIINWSLAGLAKGIDSESINLYGKVLGWMLTTPDRTVRDKATKAIVSIFENRLEDLHRLLFDKVQLNFGEETVEMSFLDADDPYVIERLLASAYGATIRSLDLKGLSELAQATYDRYFANGSPPSHILLRDYARGIVEFALCKCIAVSGKMELIRPPYSNEWPDDPPTKDEIESKYGDRDDLTEIEWAGRAIYSSVMTGDFGIYTIGAGYKKHPLRNWTATPQSEPCPASIDKQLELFISSLPAKERDAINEYEEFKQKHLPIIRIKLPDDKEVMIGDTDLDGYEKEHSKALKQLHSIVSELHFKTFFKLKNSVKEIEGFSGEYTFRWVIARAYNLGWDAELHGEFDRWVNYGRNFRQADKPERIGKKYQWIAWHEFQGYLSDHHYYLGYSDEPHIFQGIWELYSERDIDPSLLARNSIVDKNNIEKPWWIGVDYNSWRRNDPKWYRETDDLPKPEQLVDICNSKTKDDWIALGGHFDWSEPIVDGYDRYDKPFAQVWYLIQPYLISSNDLTKFKNWAKLQWFYGRWMPEYQEGGEVFLKEFHWAPIYNQFDYETAENSRSNHKCPVELRFPLAEYSFHSGYDCSGDGITDRIKVPSKYLAELLNLQHSSKDGKWVDCNNNLIAFDPSLPLAGNSSTLLIRKEALMEALRRDEKTIVFTMIGEKMLMSHREKWSEGIERLNISGYIVPVGKSFKSFLDAKSDSKMQNM